MDGTPTLLTAFGAGCCSLVSPSVVPLLPGYLAFVWDRGAAGAVLFLTGFSAVFVALGASASVAGQFMLEHLRVLEPLAGLLIVIAGLARMGVLARVGTDAPGMGTTAARAGIVAALPIGMAFGVAWTPLGGVVLNRITEIATSRDAIATGVGLLAAYAAGRAAALLAAWLLVSRLLRAPAVGRPGRLSAVAAGALLVATGALTSAGAMPGLASALADYLPLF